MILKGSRDNLLIRLTDTSNADSHGLRSQHAILPRTNAINFKWLKGCWASFAPVIDGLKELSDALVVGHVARRLKDLATAQEVLLALFLHLDVEEAQRVLAELHILFDLEMRTSSQPIIIQLGALETG